MLEPQTIVDALVRTLTSSVLPGLAPGYARGQMYAVLEVLDNIAPHLVLGGEVVEAEIGALVKLAAVAAQELKESSFGDLRSRAKEYGQADLGYGAAKRDKGRRLACDLIEAGLGDRDGCARGKTEQSSQAGVDSRKLLGEAIDEYLVHYAMLGAMAIKPSRLAQISEG